MALAAVAAPAYAGSAGASVSAAVSKSTAAAAAQKAHGGKVLSVDEVQSKGKRIYTVKLLLDGGVIKVVNVDADTGRVI